MVEVGETIMLPLGPLPIPTNVPPQIPEYHFHEAPVPNVPPVCVNVIFEPVQPVAGLAGDFISHNNNIVTKLNRSKPTKCYCSGIQVINPSLINKLVSGTDDFNEVWAQLIAQQQLACSNIYPKQWYTVDTMEQLDFANKKLDQ